MNYNFPYYGIIPVPNATTLPIRGASGGIFKRLLGGFNIGSILTNTQKTLNLVNQVIPIVKQVNPLVKNAKTMFRVMNEFKKIDGPKNNVETTSSNSNLDMPSAKTKVEEMPNSVKNKKVIDEGPVFFVN